MWQGVADRRQQGLRVEGLAEESADALGSALVGNLVAARDQENWQIRSHLLHQVTKFEAVHARHPDVRDEHVEA